MSVLAGAPINISATLAATARAAFDLISRMWPPASEEDREPGIEAQNTAVHVLRGCLIASVETQCSVITDERLDSSMNFE